ncbi:MAG TPA: minor capsid protein [Terriglobales bacterium]
MTSIDAIIQRLVDEGVGVRGTTIFAGTESDLPTADSGFITVLETGGRPPIGTHNEGPTALRQPSFQITARAGKYRVARNLAEQVHTALTFSNLQIGDRFFLYAAPMQEPFSLPNDANGRVRVAVNIETTHR